MFVGIFYNKTEQTKKRRRQRNFKTTEGKRIARKPECQSQLTTLTPTNRRTSLVLSRVEQTISEFFIWKIYTPIIIKRNLMENRTNEFWICTDLISVVIIWTFKMPDNCSKFDTLWYEKLTLITFKCPFKYFINKLEF